MKVCEMNDRGSFEVITLLPDTSQGSMDVLLVAALENLTPDFEQQMGPLSFS